MLFETSGMRVLRQIKVVTSKDRERSDGTRRDLGVENITLKAKQARLLVGTHILQMDEENKMEVGGVQVRGSRGQQE